MITQSDCLLRARTLEAFEAIQSLDTHADNVRLILVEASLLTDKYRHVRRHDVPHIAELSGLIDLLWQEVEMANAGVEEEPLAAFARF